MTNGLSLRIYAVEELQFDALGQSLGPMFDFCGMDTMNLGRLLRVLRCTVSSRLGSEQLEPSLSGPKRFELEVNIT